MDYLHLSTADVAILKGSWAVLEDHVTRWQLDILVFFKYAHFIHNQSWRGLLPGLD